VERMLKQVELKILASFFPSTKGYTTREIEIKSGYSHERVYTTLMNLVKQGYLIKRKAGKTYIFRLNLQKDLLLPYLYFQTEQKENFLNSVTPFVRNALNEFIEKIGSSDLVSVVIFGSYAKGEQRKESDIDVLCVTRKKYDIDKVALSLRHKYDKRITPVVVLFEDFPNMKRDNPTFYNELMEFGIVLYGVEAFYRLIYGEKS
jgi:predicted nucleotidyltransferase